jgi:hypothetical protein
MNEETKAKMMVEIYKKFSPEEQEVILRYHQAIAHVIIASATILKVLDEADLLDKKKEL